MGKPMTPGFGFVIMLCCAAFYYKIGEMERSSGLLWGAISLLLWLVASYFLGWGMPGCLLIQFGLFVGLTLWNVIRGKRTT
jgi:uncharacterized membrane protein YfcA